MRGSPGPNFAMHRWMTNERVLTFGAMLRLAFKH
jgi:hypothetical protein